MYLLAAHNLVHGCVQAESPVGSFKRSTPYLQSPIFNMYHSEHEMLRYLKRLENRCALCIAHTILFRLGSLGKQAGRVTGGYPGALGRSSGWRDTPPAPYQ